jgi:hypothetical protein
MKEQYSPTFAKTFHDVATVEEYYHWLDSGFAHSAFSPNSFDGSVRREDAPAGTIHGQNTIIGAVRIAQLRDVLGSCPGSQPTGAYQCYGAGANTKVWDMAHESTAAFGLYSPPAGNSANSANSSSGGGGGGGGVLPKRVGGGVLHNNATTRFLRNGIFGTSGAPVPGETVRDERAMWRQSFYTKNLHATYPAPSHAVLFDPRDGLAANSAVVRNLTAAGYIDLQTRAVFVDVSVYNPTLDLTATIRMVAEMPVGGGVMTSYHIEAAQLYVRPSGGELALDVIIALFYAYYLVVELREIRDDGYRACLARPRTWLMLINIWLYIVFVLLWFQSLAILPASLQTESVLYAAEVRSSMEVRSLAVKLQATNTFLNWFKMITYLSYSPSFGVLTDTLTTAASEIFGFAFIFFVIFFGFAQVQKWGRGQG